MTAASQPRYRQRLSYHAAVLGGMALFVSIGLMMGNMSTRHDIELRRAEDLRASLQKVIPAGIHDNDLLQDRLVVRQTDDAGRVSEMEVYRARREGEVTGVAFRIIGQGYAGDIVILLGIDAGGTILGTRVLSHAETPGLGDKIEAQKSDWILGFAGLSLSNPTARLWKVKKDGGRFDQFTGATITPRGVVKAIHAGLTFFQEHRTELLTTDSPQGTEVSEHGNAISTHH